MEEKKVHRHHHHEHLSKKQKIKRWFKNNWKIIFIALILLMFLIGIIFDKKRKNVYDQNVEVVPIQKNYDAIITVVDGEGESTFTEVWGELIKEGYPICSDLVTDYVGTEGHMDWDTIEALNDVGVEFLFHSSAHSFYNNMTKEETINDIERGINAMEEHDLKHDVVCWLSGTDAEHTEFGKNYFKAGIVDSATINPITGDKSEPMRMKNYFGSNGGSYYSLEQLIQLIEQARANNGWVILFTRNNHKMMDETQIDIYRQAFEYAKEHNVAVVTASEGYDLYYGNKLGNSK